MVTKQKLFNRIKSVMLAVMLAVSVFCCFPTIEKEVAEAKAEELRLIGGGSSADPYRIKTLQDFIEFRDSVNNGMTYEDCYVVQDADIDLSLIANFVPIGNEESHFKGVYNGQGHTIKNVLVNGKERAGIFAYLDGEVRNFGVESGRFTGEYVASIVVKGSSSSVLYNCYSKAYVNATTRGGGIADTVGKIFNCWYYSSNSLNIPLIGNDAKNMFYCYAPRLTRDSIFKGELTCCEEYEGEYFYTQEFEDRLNLGRAVTLNNLVWDDEHLMCWKVDGGTPVFSDDLRPWQGNGTSSDPYLLNTVEDFVLLSVRVNQGAEYKSEFFLQTADFDLEDVYNFVPIGYYGGDKYFFGTYDGGGKKINNLLIKSLSFSYNNGMFGRLGGTVRNVYLMTGDIYGANCGSIASHGVNKDTLILNCYSSANVHGSSRSGGLVDNFDGRVYNSVYVNYNQRLVFLCSYSASELRNCYSTGGIMNPNTFSKKGICQDCGFISTDTYIRDYEKLLNQYIVQYAQDYRLPYDTFYKWKVDDTGRRFVFDGVFEMESLSDDILDIINKHYTDRLIVIKLILCSSVIIAISIVVDVLVKRYRKRKTEIARKGN